MVSLSQDILVDSLGTLEEVVDNAQTLEASQRIRSNFLAWVPSATSLAP